MTAAVLSVVSGGGNVGSRRAMGADKYDHELDEEVTRYLSSAKECKQPLRDAVLELRDTTQTELVSLIIIHIGPSTHCSPEYSVAHTKSISSVSPARSVRD